MLALWFVMIKIPYLKFETWKIEAIANVLEDLLKLL